ncbi:Hypothetical protein GLP15_2200 [Giardia lamblia P15]|uniref:Uncharacterized protein n=1 Tax=Giardia intestinalis (strain P15) TaxID=658858 RepID=E1F6V1_GIAIA|nr:Hypothetical protein GLP15_2200 [Giardia lamblia P15]
MRFFYCWLFQDLQLSTQNFHTVHKACWCVRTRKINSICVENSERFMSLTAVSDLLKESDAMLDEVLRIRTIIQQSKDASAAELLRRVRYEAAAAQFIPSDTVTTQQLEENARLLEEQAEVSSDVLKDLRLTDEEVHRFELELQERAAEGVDKVLKSTTTGGPPKPGSRHGHRDVKESSNRPHLQGKSRSSGRQQKRPGEAQRPSHILSADTSMSAEQSDSSHNCGDSAVLLSAILQEGASCTPENNDGNHCDTSTGAFSETQDLDEMLDGLLEYHEQLENDRVDGCRGRVFQTELPTILESQAPSADASQCGASEAFLPPDPTYNPNNIYNPNFTVLLTEKENEKIEKLLAENLSTENAFRPSNEDIRRDAEICAQLSMLVPLDRSDMIYAPTFTTEVSADETVETASKRPSRPYTHNSSSTFMTLSEPSHMTERGRELWTKHTKGLSLGEPLDIFVPRLKSGVPDYLKEQRRDNILAQYYFAISQCLNEIKKDTSLIHMTGEKVKEILTDFYMTPTNFELVGDLHKAVDSAVSSSLPLRSIGDDEAPLTPQLIQKPEDLVRNILPPEDRKKLDDILSRVRSDALKVLETDEYYKDLNLTEYIKTATALQDLNVDSESSPKSYTAYSHMLDTDDNPGIQDPLLLKIYRKRQAIAQNVDNIENNSCNYSSSISDDYDFEDYKCNQLLTDQEINRETKRLLDEKHQESGKLYTILQDGTGLNTEVMSGAAGPTIAHFSLHQNNDISAAMLGGTTAASETADKAASKTRTKKQLTNAELLAKKSESLSNKFQEIINRSKPSEMTAELNHVYEGLQPDDVDRILSGPQVNQHIQTLKRQGIALLDLEPVDVECSGQSMITQNMSVSSTVLGTSSGRSSAKPVLAKSNTKASSSKVHSRIPQIQNH